MESRHSIFTHQERICISLQSPVDVLQLHLGADTTKRPNVREAAQFMLRVSPQTSNRVRPSAACRRVTSRRMGQLCLSLTAMAHLTQPMELGTSRPINDNDEDTKRHRGPHLSKVLHSGAFSSAMVPILGHRIGNGLRPASALAAHHFS